MNMIKTIFGIGAGLLLCGPVTAQSNNTFDLDSEQYGFSAGAKLTVPFGTQSHDRSKDKARFGVTLSFDRQYQRRFSGITEIKSADLLELGFYEGGDPNIMLYGQDIYRPLFDPLYADEEQGEDGAKKDKDNTLLYIAGIAGATTIVTVVLLADAVDDFNDCFLNLVDPPRKCRD